MDSNSFIQNSDLLRHIFLSAIRINEEDETLLNLLICSEHMFANIKEIRS